MPNAIRCRPMQAAIAAVSIGLSSLLHITACNAEPWPQLRGPDRSGVSHEKGLFQQLATQDPPLVWSISGVGRGYSSVSVEGDRLYTTGDKDGVQVVSALNTNDGSIAWQQPITSKKPEHDYEGARSTPSIDGDRVYVCGSDGSIHCLDKATGSIKWSRLYSEWNGKMMSGWGYSESPLVDGDLVLCTPGADHAVVVALNKNTGVEVWSAAIPDPEQDAYQKDLREGAGYSSIMVSHAAGIKQYVTLVGRGVIGVRATDGKLMWRYTRVGNTVANIPTVVIDGDSVFCSTAYDTGSALLQLVAAGESEVRAEERYFLPQNKLQNKHGGMVLVDGFIYCGHGNGSGLPVCVEMKTGEIKWGPLRGAGRGEASVAYADGLIIFRFEDGVVSFVKATPESYQVVRSFTPAVQDDKSWAYPALSEGRMYLREQDHIMCYDVK